MYCVNIGLPIDLFGPLMMNIIIYNSQNSF